MGIVEFSGGVLVRAMRPSVGPYFYRSAASEVRAKTELGKAIFEIFADAYARGERTIELEFSEKLETRGDMSLQALVLKFSDRQFVVRLNEQAPIPPRAPDPEIVFEISEEIGRED